MLLLWCVHAKRNKGDARDTDINYFIWTLNMKELRQLFFLLFLLFFFYCSVIPAVQTQIPKKLSYIYIQLILLLWYWRIFLPVWVQTSTLVSVPVPDPSIGPRYRYWYLTLVLVLKPDVGVRTMPGSGIVADTGVQDCTHRYLIGADTWSRYRSPLSVRDQTFLHQWCGIMI